MRAQAQRPAQVTPAPCSRFPPWGRRGHLGQRARALQPSLPRRGHARSDSSSRQRRSTDVAQRSRLDGPPFWTLLSVVTRVTPGAVPPRHQPARRREAAPQQDLAPEARRRPATGAWHKPLSRDRVDSSQGQSLEDGIQRHIQEKHPEEKEQAPRSAGLPGCAGLSWPRPRSAAAVESGWTLRSHLPEARGTTLGTHLGKARAEPPAAEAPAPLTQGGSQPPSLWARDSRGGTSSSELQGSRRPVLWEDGQGPPGAI